MIQHLSNGAASAQQLQYLDKLALIWVRRCPFVDSRRQSQVKPKAHFQAITPPMSKKNRLFDLSLLASADGCQLV